MFSGIIESKAKILKRDGWLFTVENTFKEPLVIGQSIAHDGACMTVTEWDSEKYSFFVMQESLNVTNFQYKKDWEYFNIERCVKVGDRIDGHIVSGHIDTIWEISKLEKWDDGSLQVFVQFDEKYSKYVIPKGSITINGTSLTVVKEWKDFLSVWLIPLTQEVTNLWMLQVWDKVNLEFDLVGKYIFKQNRD